MRQNYTQHSKVHRCKRLYRCNEVASMQTLNHRTFGLVCRHRHRGDGPQPPTLRELRKQSHYRMDILCSRLAQLLLVEEKSNFQLNIIYSILFRKYVLSFVIVSNLFSKSLPDSTYSRNMSSAMLHYLMSGSFGHVVVRRAFSVPCSPPSPLSSPNKTLHYT